MFALAWAGYSLEAQMCACSPIMFTVYVLRSLKSGKRYVGSTSKPADVRLEEHHSGTNYWTRMHRPFKIIRTEQYKNGTEARQRERFLKSGQGRKFLDSLEK